MSSLSLRDRRLFCKEGILPRHMTRKLTKGKAGLKQRLELFQAECPLPTAGNAPMWVKTVRRTLGMKNQEPYFPETFKKNAQDYKDALSALYSYRKIKSYHRMWAGLTFAAETATVQYDSTETQAVVVFDSNKSWNVLGQALGDKFIDTLLYDEKFLNLKDRTASKVLDKKLATKLFIALDVLDMLTDVKELGDAKRLANQMTGKDTGLRYEERGKRFKYKLSYFVDLLVATKRLSGNKTTADVRRNTYHMYKKYDKAFWDLSDAWYDELKLRSKPTSTWKSGTGGSSVRPPADKPIKRYYK